jgi:hypothetical protein
LYIYIYGYNILLYLWISLSAFSGIYIVAIRCIFIESRVGYIANEEGYTLYVIITRPWLFNRSLIRLEVAHAPRARISALNCHTIMSFLVGLS